MKNIIKRGTSLLLVLAMLLSFAAVVGAEEPTAITPESGKILTLTVGNIVLKAGENYIPVYASVLEGYRICNISISARSSNPAITIDAIYQAIPKYIEPETGKITFDKSTGALYNEALDGGVFGSSGSEEKEKGFSWMHAETGFTADMVKNLPVCYIKVSVQSTAEVGAYQISVGPMSDSTDKFVYSVWKKGEPAEDHFENETTLNAGTAVVIPATASLPTVILTKTAFEAPTQAGLSGADEVRGDYALTKYVKLVTDTGLVDVTDLSVTLEAVNGASLNPVSLKEVNGVKTLSLSTAAVKDAQYKLKVSSANGNTFAPEVELPFTVSKNPVFTMAGFEKGGSCAKQSDFKDSYKGPKYTSGTVAPAYVSLTPMAFDQYGMPLEKNQYTATTEFELYADKDYKNRITDTTGFSVETSGSLKISDLKTDVWCQVRAKATVGTTEKYGEWIRFRIESLYPQPKKAIISLTDGTNPVSNTIEIPAIGAPDKTITYAVTSFIDQSEHTMDENTKPKSYTVTPNMKGTGTSPVSGVTDKDSTITVTSAAVSDSPITVTFTVKVEGKKIDAYLTDTTTPATLTIKKADPIASSLASMENGTGDYQRDKIFPASGSAFPTVLPGIGEEKTVELVPLYVLDQYDQPITNEYAQAANFQLYKVDSTTETKIDSDCVKFESAGNTNVKLLLINKPGTDGKVVLKEGTYKIKAEWNGLAAQSASFTLTEAARVYTGVAEFYGQSTIYVPYKHGTLDSTKTSSTVLGAILKDQYGETKTGVTSTVPEYTLSEIKLNGKEVTDNAVTVAKAASHNGGQIEIKLSPDAAKYFGDKEEINLTATMMAKINGETVSGIPVKITVKKDASKLAHLKVTGTASDGTTGFTKEATILDDDVTASYNLIVPNESSRTYTIALSDVEDQYGTALRDWVRTTVIATAAQYDNGTLTINPQSAGSNAVFTFEANANDKTPESEKHSLTLTLNFAQMSFVNSDGADYKVYMWMNTNERTYGQDGKRTWAEVCTKWGVAAYPDVHIRTEDGKAGEKVTDKVKVVVKDNKNNVVFDSFETYTEQRKANAGDYTIELIYVKQEGAEAKKTEYPIDSTPFKITPKTVTITASGTITKEYDGTQSLVLPSSVTLTIEGNPADLTVDPSALQYASADASAAAINIVLAEGKTTCLTGDAAANYTADPSELKGTITARQLTVTPNEKTFTYGQDTEINAALASEYTVSNNLEGEKAAKITGSMKLTTTSGADVTVYDAGTYNVVNKDLSAGTNYEIEFPATSVQWTISKKSVDPFNVTLEAEYGINGSELYAMLNTAKVTVDGQQVNLSTLYNVEALYIKGVDENNLPKTDALVNAGEYTVTSLPATTLGSANYEFKTAPTLKIKVKPHVLTDADVQLSGETSAGFDGTKKTVTVTVSFTYNRRPVTLTENTDYTITGEVEASNAGGHYLTVTAKPNGNLSGSVQKRWQIWPYEIQPGDLTFKLKSGVTFTYDTTPKKPQKSDVTWDVTATDAKRKAFLKTYFTEDDFNLDCLARTDAGDYTASASMRHNFVKSKEIFKMGVSWTIGKSSVRPLSNQTAKTKYGQPGSLTVTLSEGQYKGLTNGAWTVRDIGNIFESAVAEYKDGVVTINWKLKDTTKAGDTGSFKVTVPASTNYEGYEFTVTVNVTAKDAQTGFGFTYANPIVGYAEDTYTNPVQNAKTTPKYTSSNESVATVDSNGVVTIKDVGKNVTITATAPENGEYASATASYTLTVVPSTLTVTASSATMTANDPVPSFTASVTGLKRGQTTAQVFQTLTASAATDGKTAGTYAVNASATLKADFVPRYTLRFVPGTLTVNPAQTAIDVVLPIIISGNTCANGYANCACESFYDLDASRWYHEAIDWAYSLGLMNGTTKSTFGPNAAATRAQTWTMLARIAGQDTRRSSTWYEVGQKWAVNLGITDGTNPMGSLTREQLAAMLYRYVGSPAVNGTLTFTDSANVSTWARNAMIWAVQNGILDGVGGNRLNPKGTTTRAQAAAIFMRFSKLINK